MLIKSLENHKKIVEEVKNEIIKEKDEIVRQHLKGYEMQIEEQKINETIEHELNIISAENKFNKRSTTAKPPIEEFKEFQDIGNEKIDNFIQ